MFTFISVFIYLFFYFCIYLVFYLFIYACIYSLLIYLFMQLFIYACIYLCIYVFSMKSCSILHSTLLHLTALTNRPVYCTEQSFPQWYISHTFLTFCTLQLGPHTQSCMSTNFFTFFHPLSRASLGHKWTQHLLGAHQATRRPSRVPWIKLPTCHLILLV